MRLGLSSAAIGRRLQMGRLHRLHRGVYAVGHRLVSRDGRWLAAVLACGSGGVLSHRAAAALWGLRHPVEGAVDVTVPRKSRSSSDIRRHTSRLPPDERTVERAIPVTTVPRTIFDVAATAAVEAVEAMLRESEYRRLHDRLSLWDLVERYPGRRGARKVRLSLERLERTPPGRIRSRFEERFVRFLHRHRLPRPRFNDWIVVEEKRFQVDCHWPGTGQIVELDGWEGHGTRFAFREDRARDRTLRAAGYSVTRLAWAQLGDEAEAVAADLRRLLART